MNGRLEPGGLALIVYSAVAEEIGQTVTLLERAVSDKGIVKFPSFNVRAKTKTTGKPFWYVECKNGKRVAFWEEHLMPLNGGDGEQTAAPDGLPMNGGNGEQTAAPDGLPMTVSGEVTA